MPRALPALEREAVPDARPPVAARRSRPATARPEPQARRATGLKEGSSPTPTCREQVGLKARRCNPGNLRPPGALPLVRTEPKGMFSVPTTTDSDAGHVEQKCACIRADQNTVRIYALILS